MNDTCSLNNLPLYPFIHPTTLKNTVKLCAYCRAVGAGVGLFLIGWGLCCPARWDYSYPNLTLAQSIFYGIYGLLLALPIQSIKIHSLFKAIYTLFIVLSISFVFVQVFDTMFQYCLASELRMRPAPPVFQSMLVFFTLLQIPTILFYRKPYLLH